MAGTKKDTERPDSDKSKHDAQVERIKLKHSRLLKKLAKSDNPQKSDIAVLQYLYKMSLDLLPLAQADYIKSRRGMYAIISMQNQLRELQNDLRSLNDGNGNVEHIMKKIIGPALQTIMQQILSDMSNIKLELEKVLPPKKVIGINERLNDSFKAYGLLLNTVQQQVEEKMSSYLVG